jgi:hypothetical protein
VVSRMGTKEEQNAEAFKATRTAEQSATLSRLFSLSAGSRLANTVVEMKNRLKAVKYILTEGC